MRGPLNYAMLRAFGVKAVRSSYAQIFLNRFSYGLYFLYEDSSEDWLLSRYGDAAGNLYKAARQHASLVAEGRNASIYSNNGSYYEQASGNGNWSDFVSLIYAIAERGDSFVSQLGSIFDLDNFIRILVFEANTADWDGYTIVRDGDLKGRKNQSDFFFFFFRMVTTGNFIIILTRRTQQQQQQQIGICLCSISI